ncbi:MAG: UDP-2,3-diacylglucosamine diphosphatase [Wenzhouxiangella sp.]|nr:MAG: UDP-2,3-diacylglucosamine diphosphatase [Wenzhouxiangella sp.]
MIYCIADLHLEAGRPETTRLLLDFLSGPARRARSLCILGDLFEAWVGDDGADEMARTVARALRDLADSGTALYYLHGNRDFLLGEQFCRSAGMERLDEPVICKDWHPPTALMHGDSLCTDDEDYQRFRTRVRSPAWQARVLSRPLWWRRILAGIARLISRRRNRGKPAEIMDVNADAVRACFHRLGVQRLIHGHTHRPGVQRLEVDGQPCERITLGDWHGERGSVLQILGDQARLMILRRDADGDVVTVPA